VVTGLCPVLYKAERFRIACLRGGHGVSRGDSVRQECGFTGCGRTRVETGLAPSQTAEELRFRRALGRARLQPCRSSPPNMRLYRLRKKPYSRGFWEGHDFSRAVKSFRFGCALAPEVGFLRAGVLFPQPVWPLRPYSPQKAHFALEHLFRPSLSGGVQRGFAY